MKSIQIFGIFMVLVLSYQISFSIGQEFTSDAEVVDIKVRVSEVTWDLTEYRGSGQNGTFINFNVSLELWNPYDKELVSLGSSSCRWLSSIEFSSSEPQANENSGEACTEDYGQRFYPSGLSAETSLPSILLLDSIVTTIPDGVFLINDYRGLFSNKTDNSFGLNITIINGVVTEEFEQVPSNWGDILFAKQSSSSASATGSLNFNVNTALALFLLAIPIYRRKLSE